MTNTQVKLLILCGNLILSDAALTITHICSECVKCTDGDSCCKSCIPKKVCAPNNYVNDEDSGSTDDFTDDFTDDRDVHVECQKCTACDSKYVCFERFFSPQTSRCTEMSKKDFSSILPDDKLIVTQISSTASPSLFTEEKSSRNTPPSSESKDSSLLIKNNNTDSSLAYVGTALGGVVFGSIVTSFVCIYLRRRSRTQRKRIRKQESGVHQIRNYAQHCLSKPVEQGYDNGGNAIYSEIEDKKRNSEDLFHKSPIEKGQTIDDTNRDDHVKAMQESSVNAPISSHGYGTVTVDSDGNVKRSEDGESIDDVKSSEKAEADEYFVLEKVQ